MVVGEMTSRPMERWREAKRPGTRLAGSYGHPLHPLLVPVPIGAWLASLVFDVGSHAGGPARSLYVGSCWLIGIGVVVALAATVLGYLDLLRVPAGTAVFRIGLMHMALNLVTITLYIADFLLRWAWRPAAQGVQPGLIVLSAVAFSVMAVAGWLGGKLAYRYGVRVVDESAQLDGYGDQSHRVA